MGTSKTTLSKADPEYGQTCPLASLGDTVYRPVSEQSPSDGSVRQGPGAFNEADAAGNTWKQLCDKARERAGQKKRSFGPSEEQPSAGDVLSNDTTGSRILQPSTKFDGLSMLAAAAAAEEARDTEQTRDKETAATSQNSTTSTVAQSK